MTSMPPISSVSAQAVSIPFIPANNQDLSDAITRLAGHINAAQYRFLKLLAALIEREAWLGCSGMKSPAHWLNYYCGIDLGAAREKVRVARSLAALPQIDASFRTGAISYSKVRAMTRCATPENEGHLLQIAQYGTAQHVEKLVRKFERAKRFDDPQHDSAQYEAREFSWYYDDDGMLIFNGRLPAAEGAAFVQAMDVMLKVIDRKDDASAPAGEHTASAGQEGQTPCSETRFAQQCACGAEDAESVVATDAARPPIAKNVSAETFFGDVADVAGAADAADAAEVADVADFAACTFPQKRADALVAMADLALNSHAAGVRPLVCADKYQVMVHLDAAQLGQPSAQGGKDAQTSLESSGCHFPITATTARRLACDASLVTVLEDGDGTVLNVGRKTRIIPPSIRRALGLRDHGCRYPGCCEVRFVDAHHIRHWCDGGETRLDNLVLLCRHHHRLLHQGTYDIVKEAASIEFVLRDGSRLLRALVPQFIEADDARGSLFLETEHQVQRLGIDARTAVTAWCGERMDYGFAVGTLLDIRDASMKRVDIS